MLLSRYVEIILVHDTRLCLAKRKVVNLRYSKVVLVSDKITSFILLTILTKNIPFIKTIFHRLIGLCA